MVYSSIIFYWGPMKYNTIFKNSKGFLYNGFQLQLLLCKLIIHTEEVVAKLNVTIKRKNLFYINS